MGNNMFAYCNNNPANCSDSTGTVAKICLTADGRIEDSPWRNHSPRGGGFVYHCNDITTQYDGDKFFTQILFRNIGKFAEKCWNAYVHSNELQVQNLHQQNMAVREHWDYVFANPERTNDFLAMVVADISAYWAYAKLAAASTVALGPILGTAFVVGGAIVTTLNYYGVIDIPDTWEEFWK